MTDYGFTQEALASRIGKNQSTIANKIRIMRLPKSVQKLITDNNLTERHARALLKLTNEADQIEVVEKVIKQGLTVRRTEAIIEEMLSPAVKAVSGSPPFKAYIRDIRILTNTIKENLDMVRQSGIDTEFDMEQTDTGYNIIIKLNYTKGQVAKRVV